MIVKERTRGWAIVERQGAQERLQRLSQRLQDLGQYGADRLEVADVKVAMARVFDTMEACDHILSPVCDPVLPTIPTATEDATTRRQQRMRALVAMIQNTDGLPAACHSAARALRRQLLTELRGGPSVGHRR